MVLLALNVKRLPFDDARIRGAAAYANNYKQLIESQANGYGRLWGGQPFLGPLKDSMSYGKYDSIKPFEYSPEKAKALLKEAGAKNINIVIDSYGDYVE